jgi:hypothetical protein
MRKYVFLLLICSQQLFAQDNTSDFQQFRKELLEDYQGYRNEVLENYAKYLEGVWSEYQLFRGEKKNDKPKPVVAPVVGTVPQKDDTPIAVPAPEAIPKNCIPVPKVKPELPTVPALSVSAPMLDFKFYGNSLKAIMIKTHKVTSLEPRSIALVWRGYQEDCPKEAIDEIRALVLSLGLNDWFTYELVRCYADDLLKSGSSSDRIVLQHYLLANLGYDVRLGCTKNQLLLLLPVAQQMYERDYLKINGRSYYIYLDNLSPIAENIQNLYTCDLPQNADSGRPVSLIFYQRTMNVAFGDDRKRTLSDGKLHVSCSVNSGLMEMLRRYPLMDVPCYAESNVLPPFHQDLLRQLRPQLKGLSQKQAANALLHFVQHAFEYATDEEQHGYEKPYFIEENFYYPQNDCEDRAIFYAFLIHYLLGLDVYLVHYPGHECTAVNFTDAFISGDGFIYNNTTYLICDPTYINANIGQCMPEYRNVRPTIEAWY